MSHICPDVDLAMLLMKAIKTLGIDTSARPPVSSNGPGHARYRRSVVTDRAHARQVAKQYGAVLQESMPRAYINAIVEYVDEAPDSGFIACDGYRSFGSSSTCACTGQVSELATLRGLDLKKRLHPADH